MTFTTDDLWASLAQQVLKIAAPSFDPASQQFSLAATTLSLDLAAPDPLIVNGEVYAVGNTVPAFGPRYAPGSALLAGYQAFLDAIDLRGDSNPNLDSQMHMAAAMMAAAQNNFRSVQPAAIQAWTMFRTINPYIGFYDYVTQQYPVFLQARNALAAATSRWQQLAVMKYGQGYEIIANARGRLSPIGGASDVTAQNAYNMAVRTGAVIVADTVPRLPGQDLPLPASAMIPAFAPAFSLQGFGAAYQAWTTSAVTATSIELSGAGASADWSTLGWGTGGDGTFGQGFLSLWNGLGLPAGESGFAATGPITARIGFRGIGSFAIEPGAWFDQGIVQAYRTRLLPGAPAFFDPAGGALARRPAQAVIGYGPGVALTLGSADYAAFKAGFQSPRIAAAGFGPLLAGSATTPTLADKSAVRFDDGGLTVTLPPQTGAMPILLGVVSSRLDA